jgi:predicted O-methyltransferase YrrM
MQHCYQEIQGWFDFGNIYETMVQLAPQKAHFVEIGTWKGKSAAFMCVEIANSGKAIKFDCVDTWDGAGSGYADDPNVKAQTLYEEFQKNMEPVQELYTPIREWSDKAAVHYEDASLDFVFIDAGHAYENVKADILAWRPKVKPGGFLAGHDYHSAEGVKQAVTELLEGHDVDNNSWIIQIN